MKVGDIYTFRSDKTIGPFRGKIESIFKTPSGTRALVSEIQPTHPPPYGPVFLMTTVILGSKRKTRRIKRGKKQSS